MDTRLGSLGVHSFDLAYIQCIDCKWLALLSVYTFDHLQLRTEAAQQLREEEGPYLHPSSMNRWIRMNVLFAGVAPPEDT